MQPAIKNPPRPFQGVLVEEIDLHWPVILEWVELALDRTGVGGTIDEIYSDLSFGLKQLWLVGDGFAITSLIDTRRGKTLMVNFIGGNNLESWLHELYLGIDRVAKYQGCDKIAGYGRRGWERLLRSYGFKTEIVIVSRDVNYD